MDFSKEVVIDFESYYDDECSVRKLGPQAYTRHPHFDAFLVSVVHDTLEWVGHPSDFAWNQVDGFRFGAHNVGFDATVLEWCKLHKVIPSHIQPAGWFDTADLVSYLHCVRSLAGAVKGLFGAKLEKDLRTSAKGKSPVDMIRDGSWGPFKDYCLSDSKWSWKIWREHSHAWPEEEQELSEYTRTMCAHGLPMDEPLVEEGIEHLRKLKHEAYVQLPWVTEWDEKYKKHYPAQSKRGLALHCRKVGIPGPKSTAKDSPEFADWLEDYGTEHTFVQALSDYRGVNAQLVKQETCQIRIRDGRMPYGLKFGGTHTMRDAGDSGFNALNMPKSLLYGIDHRKRIRAAPGNALVIADMSQIEPRCFAWVVDDFELLDSVGAGMCIYESHSRTTMGYDDELPLKRQEDDPEFDIWALFRDLSKLRVLSLQYGSGWHKLFTTCRARGMLKLLEAPIDEETAHEFQRYVTKWTPQHVKDVQEADEETFAYMCNAWIQVRDFRSSNKKYTDFWKTLDTAYKSKAGGTYSLELPNGYCLKYYDIRAEPRGYTCKTEMRGLKRESYYGSKIAENVMQAIARFVFAAARLQMHREGIKVILPVYDEVVIETHASEAEQVARRVQEIFSKTPDWLEGCPLASDYKITDHYLK